MARGDGELQGPEERRASKLSIAPRHSGCTLNFTVSEDEFRVATRTFCLRALSLLTPPDEPYTVNIATPTSYSPTGKSAGSMTGMPLRMSAEKLSLRSDCLARSVIRPSARNSSSVKR